MKLINFGIIVTMVLPMLTRANILDEKDKQIHIVSETVVTGIATVALKDSEHPILYPIIIGTGIGVAKEIVDKYSGGDPSYRDLLADGVGIAAGVSFGTIIVNINKNQVGLSFNKRF